MRVSPTLEEILQGPRENAGSAESFPHFKLRKVLIASDDAVCFPGSCLTIGKYGTV